MNHCDNCGTPFKAYSDIIPTMSKVERDGFELSIITKDKTGADAHLCMTCIKQMVHGEPWPKMPDIKQITTKLADI